jgi:hypothetical protein
MTFKQSIRQDLGTLSDFELNRLNRTGRVNHQTLGHQMNDQEFRPIVEDLAQDELARREERRIAAAYEDEIARGDPLGSIREDSIGEDPMNSLDLGPPSPVDTTQQASTPLEPPADPPKPDPTNLKDNDSSDKISLSEREQQALVLHFVSTTLVPLAVTDPDDYSESCSDCSTSPIVDGPHHDQSCQYHHPHIKLDTANAHKTDCRHCEARPAVAGFHHEADCPRGLLAVATWSVTASNYGVACSDCGSKPDSEGPHHDSSCKYHAPVPLYHTDQAHSGYCKECGALPYVAGPHHRHDCVRHIGGIPIPLGLVDD